MGALWIFGGVSVEGPNQDIVVILPIVNNAELDGNIPDLPEIPNKDLLDSGVAPEE